MVSIKTHLKNVSYRPEGDHNSMSFASSSEKSDMELSEEEDRSSWTKWKLADFNFIFRGLRSSSLTFFNNKTWQKYLRRFLQLSLINPSLITFLLRLYLRLLGKIPPIPLPRPLPLIHNSLILNFRIWPDKIEAGWPGNVQPYLVPLFRISVSLLIILS